MCLRCQREHGIAAATTVAASKETIMKWVDPAYCDLRLGFEVTAYVYVR